MIVVVKTVVIVVVAADVVEKELTLKEGKLVG